MWKDGGIREFLSGLHSQPVEQTADNEQPYLTKEQQDAMDEQFRRDMRSEEEKRREAMDEKFDPRKAKAQIDTLNFDIDALKGGMKVRQEQHEKTIDKLETEHIASMREDMALLDAKTAECDQLQRAALRWVARIGALKHLTVEGDSVRLPNTVRPPPTPQPKKTEIQDIEVIALEQTG